MTTLAIHKIPVHPITPEAFAPYGQIISARQTGGQAGESHEDHAKDPTEAQLMLTNGTPRLWIMRLTKVGVRFKRIARHRKVTQCLGSLGGKSWLLGVAPPSDLADSATPRLGDIVGFRIPGDCVIKLHIGAWHAGPYFADDSIDFINLELMNTNTADFHAAELGVECVLEG